MLNTKRVRRAVVAVTLSAVLVTSAIFIAAAQSTTKNLSTNITLVNLASTTNDGLLKLIRDDGSAWRQGRQFPACQSGRSGYLSQYDENDAAKLDGSGSGSGFVSASGQIGAVVQIQARGQTDTRGAYSGSSGGAESSNVPLILKNRSTASGTGNSQIIIQNASQSDTNVEVDFIGPDGAKVHTETGISLKPNASFTYDVATEPSVNNEFFGSAVVRSVTSGNQVAVVSNLFLGPHSMQTFNAFTTVSKEWLAPLFTSKLANGLSTPIAVQNLSGQTIPADSIELVCTKDPQSPGQNFTKKNNAEIQNTASFFFNPVNNADYQDGWFGACRVNTGSFDTVMFVQMRFVGTDQAASYEGIPSNGTKTKVVIPLYARRLANGFASAVTIQNLSSSTAAEVSLTYVSGDAARSECSANFTASIPASGSLIQNHRTPNGVTQLGENCFGSLVVESTNGQPIDAFVQLTDISGLAGDTFMAHNAFTVDN